MVIVKDLLYILDLLFKQPKQRSNNVAKSDGFIEENNKHHL